MDNLEKYISQNKEAFDMEVPSLNVWAGIQEQMEEVPVRRLRVWKQWRFAATVALLVVAGGIVGSYLNSAPTAKTLSDLSPEHAEMERYFNSQVNSKMAQLATYKKDQTVQADLADLDAIYAELQKELQHVPEGKEEQIIEAMINTYQTKIDILETVLEKVQSINSTTKTEGNEIRI